MLRIFATFDSIYLKNIYAECSWLRFFIKQISQQLSMETKFFKRSYFTVLRVLSFKTIKVLIILAL